MQYASIHIAPPAIGSPRGAAAGAGDSGGKAQNKTGLGITAAAKNANQKAAAAATSTVDKAVAPKTTTPKGKETAAAATAAITGGNVKMVIEQARSDYVTAVCRAEAACNHLKIYQSLIPLALYDCHGKDGKETINQVSRSSDLITYSHDGLLTHSYIYVHTRCCWMSWVW